MSITLSQNETLWKEKSEEKHRKKINEDECKHHFKDVKVRFSVSNNKESTAFFDYFN